MAEPFLSEIKIMSFNFPPKGWALCNGQLLPINQNQALFSLLGTMYGGNGQTNFALPDLRGRIPIHMGQGHTLGEAAGSPSVTINSQTMPQHIHFLQCTNNIGTVNSPDANSIISQSPIDIYRSPLNLVAMDPSIVSEVGGSQPHENRMPCSTLNFCIALQGIFPSQT